LFAIVRLTIRHIFTRRDRFGLLSCSKTRVENLRNSQGGGETGRAREAENWGFETPHDERWLCSFREASLVSNHRKLADLPVSPPPCESRPLIETEERHRSFCDSGRGLAAQVVMNR